MIAETGHYALILALGVAVVQMVLPLMGARIRDQQLMAVAGPAAQRECKALIRAVAHRPVDATVIDDTAKRIARVRATPEAKEGIGAFLDKRAAGWVPEALRKT